MGLPSWINIDDYNKKEYLDTYNIIKNNNLHTVCCEANCPNRYECFSKKTATFLIMGDVCTRNCRYCNIRTGIPEPLDDNEPQRIAETIRLMGLKYAVITCVTRDDLIDGGATHFINTVLEIHKLNPDCKIELLISDLAGNKSAIEKIVKSKPDVLNHNIEVVKEKFKLLRPKGDYQLSLDLLAFIKEKDATIKTKSGFMLGFGETKQQIFDTLNDLINVGCDIVTIGQYLQPTKEHVNVYKYYTPDEFKEIEDYAYGLGFKHVFAGPLVRSSYKASEVV